MSFTDLEQRILDKIDKLEVKLDNTCNTVTEMKTSYDNHIKSREIAEEKRNKRNLRLIGAMGVILAGFEIWRSLGSG